MRRQQELSSTMVEDQPVIIYYHSLSRIQSSRFWHYVLRKTFDQEENQHAYVTVKSDKNALESYATCYKKL